MTDQHVHGCLNCRPDMVPDFDRDDPRYHDRDKCGVGFIVTVDGAPVTYTRGVYEGADGWALFCGATTEAIHDCPNCTTYREYQGYPVADRHEVCIVPLFGRVDVVHECAAGTLAGPKFGEGGWVGNRVLLMKIDEATR